MVGLIELLEISEQDPQTFSSLLKDEKRLAAYELTSNELAVLKKLEPETIRTILEALAKRARRVGMADTQACNGGTNACASRATPIGQKTQAA